MCGRYASFRATQDLADAFGVDPEDVADDAAGLPPSWNLAPTDPVRIVVERPEKLADGTRGEPVRSLRLARWGLVPGWAKDPSIGSRLINARMETVGEKPAFRKALASRRCLVPAEGWYEWTDPPEGSPRRARKTPHWIHRTDGGLLAFAGLYEFWRDPGCSDDDPLRWLVSMTIVTGGAPADDPVIGPLHDRQPVLVDPGDWATWLDPSVEAREAAALLGAPPRGLTAVTVSTAVSSVRNDGPELIEPA
ncbi:SOS response-associated peptidase [Isoptericola sp. b441]|uniref:Abasic site processing protein n=1 Tax=Actinotalea lenta TaxID=3064654 RepID=A0ABT9DD99_9CELL|nr:MULTISPECIES: SOS response-associated peptidase [unclassified Isoptericola]MDO8106932.1 SOS response-associated peptidase [Isoptericola sp. b441]MDO8121357.1 SOS response-associated peptidase [Isoptericola sp. b490]